MRIETEERSVMRWVAALVYALLCVYQMFSMRFAFITIPNTTVAISNLTVVWLAELLLMVGAGVMAVWLFAGKEMLSTQVRRGILMASLLLIVFEIISFSSQLETYSLVLYFTFNILEQPNTTFLLYVVRLVLLAGACLAAQAAVERKPKAKKQELAEDGEAAEEAPEEKDATADVAATTETTVTAEDNSDAKETAAE